MSRSWPRVMSPSPAFSTLITSAPSQASSCVHVGPDCTCVKSRMRTPSNAFVIRELLLTSILRGSLVHGLRHRSRRVDLRVDPDVHDGAAAGLTHRFARAVQGAPAPRGVAHLFAVPAQPRAQ